MGTLGQFSHDSWGVTPEEEVRRAFPRLPAVVRTSDEAWEYNCHAWAMGLQDVWWDPSDPNGPWVPPWRKPYFPPGLPRDDFTLDNFTASYRTRGYQDADHGGLEPGWEKIALYATGSRVTHTARQLEDGGWTSKCGTDIDIDHPSAEALADGGYGRIAAYMKRRRPSSTGWDADETLRYV